jgi:hypothetical protein
MTGKRHVYGWLRDVAWMLINRRGCAGEVDALACSQLLIREGSVRNLLGGLMLAAALLGCGGGGGGGVSNDPKPTTASVTVVSSGEGKYTIQGENMGSVAGVDMVVNYDSSTLSSPAVSQGSLVSDALFAANPNYAPNAIKIAAISTKVFASSGPIAQITFSTHQANAPTPTVTCNLIDANGATISESASAEEIMGEQK